MLCVTACSAYTFGGGSFFPQLSLQKKQNKQKKNIMNLDLPQPTHLMAGTPHRKPYPSVVQEK